MRKMLEEKLHRFEELELQMQDPDVMTQPVRMASIAREHGSLAKLATKYRRFKGLNDEIQETQDMIDGDDPDMAELAKSEIESLREKREKLWNDLLEETVGGDDASRTRCVMEIRGGTGGDEAALFARDLYEMYKHHCEAKGWKFEVLESSRTELGGLKEVIVSVQGEGVYRELQYESGGHRVQRVPETETKGRIHTSAATVAVMPEPEDVEVELGPDDYRLDTYSASGPGGQHVNRTASAVRLTHHETGIVVQCQDEKSQLKNKNKAIRVLKARIYEVRKEAEEQKRADERKSLVGSGDRSQRIRTYNFPENRVSDHRIKENWYKLDEIITGNVQIVTDRLIEFDRQNLRESMNMNEVEG